MTTYSKRFALRTSLVVFSFLILNLQAGDRPLPSTPPVRDERANFGGPLDGIMLRTDEIIIPELELADANIKDVLVFLQRASVQNDRSTHGTKGVNIILAPELSAKLRDTPRLTMSLHQTSLREILDILSKILRVPYWTSNSTVVFGQADTELVVHTYDILPDTRRTISAGSEGDAAVLKAKTYFEVAGVNFPDGAGIQFLPQAGKVVFRNTSDNLIQMERLLMIVNVVPSQVETNLRLVEVLDPSTVMTNQVIDTCAEQTLVSKGMLRLLSDTTTVAIDGFQASNTIRHLVKTDKDASPVPCTTSFVVAPEVHPSGVIIHLGLRGRVSLGGDAPFEHEFTTHIELYNEASTFFWLNSQSNKELTTRYLRVTTRLVGPSGLPITPCTNLLSLIPPAYHHPVESKQE